MKKLVDSGKLGQAESKNPAQLLRTAQFYLGLLFGRRGQSTPANANNSVLAKNSWRSKIFWAEPKSSRIFTDCLYLGDSEDESDAKIFCVPDSETGQQSAPYIQLELMPRQPQQA